MSPKSPLASLLVAAVCTLAPLAQAAPAADNDPPAAEAQRSADAARAAADAARAEVEGDRAKLEAARKKLEEAANEVAELSMRGISVYDTGEIAVPLRSIIGAQLLTEPSGRVRVLSVSPGGPAAEAGLRSGDLITGINGADIHSLPEARAAVRGIRKLKPDSKVSIKLLRPGSGPLEITVTTRAAPADFNAEIPPIPAIPPIPPIPAVPPIPPIPPIAPSGAWPAWADLELATVTPQLGHYFGTDKGVLVVRAPEGGALGLKDGDVILSIDGREAVSSAQVSRILASYQAGEKFTLRIIRDHKPVSFEAALPERERGRRGPARRGSRDEVAPQKDVPPGAPGAAPAQRL